VLVGARKSREYVLRECRVANPCAFPFLLDPFRETGQSEGQRGETDGGVIPVVDTTAILIGEFLVKGKRRLRDFLVRFCVI
jgi:hypothetical protein